MPLLLNVPEPEPPADPYTPEEHAQLAFPWLKSKCAPSTWDRFVASVAVREPQVKRWNT